MTVHGGAAGDAEASVLCLSDLAPAPLRDLLGRYGLRLEIVESGAAIPGSYWGQPEAGLIADTLYAAPETPLHSILHEAGHYVCMDPTRREALHTDAGGDEIEEAGVCYLQVLLAEFAGDVDRDRLIADMDAWGYSFRLGSTRAWLEHDAEDARIWLVEHGLIDGQGRPTWRLRRR